MSRVIDNRVVQMEFDNARFERNVSQSLSTLDKLKAALSFKGSDKDIGMVENAFVSLGKSMSAFEQIGVGVLRNFGDKIANWATATIKELSGINNIISGFSKFDQMTKSAATLNAQGFATEEVEKQLERLNWFTDETSYNLTDMVDNISKFTATGQGLEDSADAMMGIALWAATAGQNAGTASRAMYQLSQAMSGYMRKEDWKSIQNANMDMKEFRELALETGVRLNKLEKNADGFYRSLDPKTKGGGEWFSVTQFADYLTEGAWFTSDVMMEVYKTYTKSANKVYEWMSKHVGTTVRDAIDALGDELDEFSLKAFKAGQEARTWGDAVDSVKDALSTKWMGVFQHIFGNAEEATVFFTNLANSFYDIFVEPMLGISEAFRLWREAGGRQTWQDALVSSLGSVYEVTSKARTTIENFFNPSVEEHVKKQTKAISKYRAALRDGVMAEDARLSKLSEEYDEEEAFAQGVAESRSKKLLGFSDRLAELSNYFSEAVGDLSVFETILKGVLSLFGIGKEAVSGFLKALSPFKEVLTAAIRLLVGFVANISTKLQSAYAKIKSNNTFYKIFSTILKPLVTLKDNIKEFYNIFMPRFLEKWEAFREKLKPITDRFAKLSESTDSFLGKIKSKWEGLFTNFNAEAAVDKVFKGLSKIKELIYAIVGVQDDDAFVEWLGQKLDDGIAKFETFKENARKTLEGLWEDIKTYFGEAVQWIGDHWNDITKGAHDVFSAIGSFFSGLWEALKGFFTNEDGTDGFESFVQTFKDLGDVLGKVIGYIIAGLKPLADGLKSTLESLSLDNAGEFLEGGGIALLGTALYKWATGFKKSNFLKAFTEVLEGIGGVLDGFTHMLDAKALKEAAIGIGILVAALLLLISMPEDKLIGAATVLSIVVTILAQSLKKLSKFSTGIKIDKEGFSGTKSGSGGALLSAALAIILLATAMRIIAKIPEKELYRAASIILILTACVSMMIKAIARIVAGDGDKDIRKVFNGIHSGNLGNNNAIIKFDGPVMTILAFTLLIIAVMKVAEKFMDMIKTDANRFVTAVGIVGVIIVVMTAALVAINKYGTTKLTDGAKASSTWATILAMAAGIYLVALAFEKIATIDRNTAGPARMAGVAVFIVGIIGMFVLLAEATKGSKFSGMGNFAKGVLGITAAISVLAYMFKMLAELPSTARFGDAIGAFVVIGVILGALLAMSSKLAKTEKAAMRLQKVAVALIGISAALAISAGALIVLSEIDGNKIGTAMVAILVALGALAGIGAIGTALGPGLLAVGEFILLIARAATIAAVGFLAFSQAIKAFSDSTLDIKKAADNISEFITRIVDRIPRWTERIISSFVGTILSLIPGTVGPLIDAIAETLDKIVGNNKLGTIIDNVLAIAIAIINGVTARAAELVMAMGDLLLTLLENVALWADENSDRISEAIRKTVEAIIHIVVSLFDGIGEKIFGKAWSNDEGTGIKDLIETVLEIYLGYTFINWLGGWVLTVTSTLAPISTSVTNILSLIGQLIAAHPVIATIAATLGGLTMLSESYQKDQASRIQDLRSYVDTVYSGYNEQFRDQIFAELSNAAIDANNIRFENGKLVGDWADKWYAEHPEELEILDRLSKSPVMSPDGYMVYSGDLITKGDKSVAQLVAENAAFRAKLDAYDPYDFNEEITREGQTIQLVANYNVVAEDTATELYRRTKSFVGVASLYK